MADARGFEWNKPILASTILRKRCQAAHGFGEPQMNANERRYDQRFPSEHVSDGRRPLQRKLPQDH